MKNARPILAQKILEIFFDSVFIFFSFVFAYLVRIRKFDSTDFPFLPFLKIAIFCIPFFLVLLAFAGLFSLQEKSNWQNFRIISTSTLAGASFFVLIFFFQREIFFSRAIILLVWFFSTFLLFFFHFWRKKISIKNFHNGKNIFRTLLIGNSRAAENIFKKLKDSGSRFQICAILTPFSGGKKEIFGIPVSGKLNQLEKLCYQKKIDAIIQTEAAEQTLNLLLFAEGNFLEFLLAPQILGGQKNNISSENIAGLPFLRLKFSPLFGWGQIWKRLMDIIFSLFLLILFFPFFLFFKVKKLLKAADPQEKTFHKLQFIGVKNKFIKIIPEFWNVFFGDMSLVGPRPVSISDRQKMNFFEKRNLIIKPGVFSPVSNEKKRSEQEATYISNWSIWEDVRIFFSKIFTFNL